MTLKEKVESYLINLGITYESIEDDAWLISDEEKGLNQVVLILEEPILIVRINVMKVPSEKRESFFEQLLRLNASDLVHGAYAIEEEDVIIVDTLESASLDLEELQASLDAISLAISQHYSILSQYRN